jgi:hypothetical protein
MQKDTKIYIWLVIIVLIIIGGIFAYKQYTKITPEEKAVKCIAGKSVLYVATGCGICAAQENILGNYSNLVKTIDCINELQTCVDANIEHTPTWIIDNKKYEGKALTIAQLKEITGC